MGYLTIVSNTKYQIPNIKYQISNAKYQMPNIKYQISNTKILGFSKIFSKINFKDISKCNKNNVKGRERLISNPVIKYQISNTKYQIPNIKYQISNIKY